MNNDDEDNELANLDLHAWRVPPPTSDRRAAILSRELSTAAPPRARLSWLTAALVVSNVLLASLFVIALVVRPAPVEKIVTVNAPAGGSSLDAEAKNALDQMKATIDKLAAKVHECEQREKTVRPTPPPGPRPQPQPQPQPQPPTIAGNCDEVSCVLTNYEGACCAKLRGLPAPPPKPTQPALPAELTRNMIATAVAALRPDIRACGDRHAATGTVKIKVRVAAAGHVTNVVVDSTPDNALGACVAAVAQTATFPATQRGGSFSYPFVFRAAP